jgi:hypothetical protein
VKTFKLALFSWLEVGDAASENSTESHSNRVVRCDPSTSKALMTFQQSSESVR